MLTIVILSIALIVIGIILICGGIQLKDNLGATDIGTMCIVFGSFSIAVAIIALIKC